MVPALRIRLLDDAAVRPEGAFVLYWMTANRRTSWNFALERAVEQATAVGKPLLVFEALRVDYHWASDRFHRFVIDGMRDNAAALAAAGVTYYPYVEPERGAGRGLLAALAAHAAVVITDDSPGFFLPRMLAAASAQINARLEAVDSNGLLPLAAADRTFATAHAFRRLLQRLLPAHLEDVPLADPLAAVRTFRPAMVPAHVKERWPAATPWLHGEIDLRCFPVDHTVSPAPQAGGPCAARRQLAAFVADGLPRYADEHSHPDADVTSRLSPYLHWGHISVHEVFAAVMRREGWPGAVARHANGARHGWWGVRSGAESFLDELITWRELGFNAASKRAGPACFDSLPPWALRTLRAHADDPRDEQYTLEAFEQARTEDPLWNAAQRQLVTEGRIHNYLRMLWGKKILHWSPAPEQAFDVMVELNNKYALDGRDPNSDSGILWVLGLYDRPWGPERSIFGTVRYMSSANTARKRRVKEYLRRYASA